MTEPNIILLDVETSPILGYTWGMYDVNVLGVVQPVKLICCAWKRLGDKKTNVRAFCDYPEYDEPGVDDKLLADELWKVVDDADVIIGHNADSFDIKVLNARFIANNLKAPSSYQTVDTLKVAKKYFKFNNNTLNELGIYLGEGRKAPTGGFETWLKCMERDKAALDRMKKYNVQDVELLERVYLRLRPYHQQHPNLNLFNQVRVKKDEFPCDVCQSTNTQKRGFSMTKVGRYQRWSCLDCGSWSQGPYQRVYKDERALTEG